LLDVTRHNIENLAELADRCEIHRPGWIRSWFGFNGGDCRAAVPFGEQPVVKAQNGPGPYNPHWFSGLFSESDRICEREELYVFCQEDRKKPARPTGPIDPSSSVSYTTTEVPVTYTSYVATVTRTVTLLGN